MYKHRLFSMSESADCLCASSGVHSWKARWRAPHAHTPLSPTALWKHMLWNGHCVHKMDEREV